MADNIFSPMERDAIGEVMNISLGSSATAISNMLDHRVEITTPMVSVSDVDQFSLGDLQPAIGVEIRYVSGLEGSNIMLLKRSDVKVIVDILLGSETPDEEFELNDLTISAVCEVMNQMMGAASTALSDFLGRPVNISTPESFELDDFERFKKDHFPSDDGKCVIVRFSLKIENVLESQFINVMSTELARDLLSGLDIEEKPEKAAKPGKPEAPEPEESVRTKIPNPPEDAGPALSQAEIERLMASAQHAAPPPQTPAPTPPAPSGEPLGRQAGEPSADRPFRQPEPQPGVSAPGAQMPSAGGAYPMPPYYGQYMPGYYPPPSYYNANMVPPEPKLVNARPAELPRLANGEQLNEQQGENLNLLMSVPLEVSVEIGRTHKKVQDILAFSKGSLVVLDKLAGDQVDLFVNGQCIARGDVVVIDDNFGIRITEVLNPPDLNGLVRE